MDMGRIRILIITDITATINLITTNLTPTTSEFRTITMVQNLFVCPCVFTICSVVEAVNQKFIFPNPISDLPHHADIPHEPHGHEHYGNKLIHLTIQYFENFRHPPSLRTVSSLKFLVYE